MNTTMAHQKLKIQKQKAYNQFNKRVIKQEPIGLVKCFLRAVKESPKDIFGAKKLQGGRYEFEMGRVMFCPHGRAYNPDEILFYEVGANDGSYRKCTTKEDALQRFAQLVEFEKKKQTEIR